MLDAQNHEYVNWSGKFIGHFISRIILRGPELLHPVLTSIVFLWLILSGIILTFGIEWRNRLRAWHIVALAGLTWFALPTFGTVFFWRTATPEYGYGLTFATAFLVPYRFWIDKKDYRFPGGPAYILAGHFAGCSNENVGMLVILIATCITIYRSRTMERIPLWAPAGIIGAIAGWIFMLAAPGNMIRFAKWMA
jgi:hypothetical protein